MKRRIRNGKEDISETVYFVEPIVDQAAPTALALKELEQTVCLTNCFFLITRIDKSEYKTVL